jgi:hypothetical protein
MKSCGNDRTAHEARETPDVFRSWLGFYQKATAKPRNTWSEAVGQLFCLGWICGVRRSLDSWRMLVRKGTPVRECSTGPESSTGPLNEHRLSAIDLTFSFCQVSY